VATADPPGPERHPVAANDNGGAHSPDPEALRKVNDVVLQIARLIGRRMARADHASAMRAANDNAPQSEPDGADT